MTFQLHSIFEDMQPDLQAMKTNADNETLYGAGVDMLGYQGVSFFACGVSGSAVSFTLKAQQDSAANFGTAADLAGSAVPFTSGSASHGFAFVEVKNPLERYVRPALVVPDVGTARSVALFSLRYGKDRLPETNLDGEMHVSPAEGTA